MKKQGFLHNIIYVMKKTWLYEKPVLISVVLLALIGVAVPFIMMYLPTVILNGVTGNQSRQHTMTLLVALCLLALLCNGVREYMMSMKETHQLNNKIHFLTDLLEKRMELDYHIVESIEGQNRFQNAMGLLMNDSRGVTRALELVSSLLEKLLGIFVYLGVISRLSSLLVIFLGVTSFLHLIFIDFVLKYEKKNRDQWVALSRKIELMCENMKSSKRNKDIKLFAMQGWLGGVLDSLLKERMGWESRRTWHNGLTAVSDLLLLAIRNGLAYYYIFSSLLAGRIEIAEFAFYFGAITGFSAFVTGITKAFSDMKVASEDIAVIRGYLEYSNTPRGNKRLELQTDAISIEFDNVTFRYSEKDEPVLDHISFFIDKGEKIALVGENGAGKSTLIKLLCGFYLPSEGSIKINGVDTREMPRDYVYSLLAVVFQDIYILPMRVSENIALTEEDKIDTERLDECLGLSGLLESGIRSELSLTQLLDPKGVNLSGGESQKVALARAIYKQSRAVVLDEPTSALDPIAERRLYQQYDMLTQNKTSIFISHRLASTKFCDRILMLDRGRIIETGTHQELMETAGKYQEIYQIQSQYYQKEAGQGV